MILVVRIRSESLVWPLADGGHLLRREPRKSQTEAPLPTGSRDATRVGNPTAGSSFLPVPAVTPRTLTQASSLGRDRDHIPFSGRPFAHLPPAIRGVPHLVAKPPRRLLGLRFRVSPIAIRTPFRCFLFRRRFSRARQVPAPWRPGAPLLSRHAGPTGFPSLPRRLAITCAGRKVNLLFRSPRKSGA